MGWQGWARGQWGVRRNLFSQEAVECVVVWEEWQGEVEIKGGQVTWCGGIWRGWSGVLCHGKSFQHKFGMTSGWWAALGCVVNSAFVLPILGILFASLGPLSPYQATVLSLETWSQELSGFLEQEYLLLHSDLTRRKSEAGIFFSPNCERLHW